MDTRGPSRQEPRRRGRGRTPVLNLLPGRPPIPLLRCLGEGGMGPFSSGNDPSHGRQFARKRSWPDHPPRPLYTTASILRPDREALNHRNVGRTTGRRDPADGRPNPGAGVQWTGRPAVQLDRKGPLVAVADEVCRRGVAAA